MLDTAPVLGDYNLSWYTIDGGGGPFVLTGTTGQPDAAYSKGGNYELLDGFWPGGPLCFVDFKHFARFADNWLPRSWDGALTRIQELLMALFCLCFAVLAFQVVTETYELNERAVVMRFVIWPIQAVIPLAFAIATLRHGMFAVWPQLRPQPDLADLVE